MSTLRAIAHYAIGPSSWGCRDGSALPRRSAKMIGTIYRETPPGSVGTPASTRLAAIGQPFPEPIDRRLIPAFHQQ
ncbi:MAG TPA: hypothetical protein VN702_08420 [Acetobacteraceae bacterium]|nr:hypothetical protein [Acetobacteraceae bacterium]